MKLTIFLILISVVSVFANKSYSQSKLLTLDMDKATVQEVLLEIEGQSKFYFMYSSKIIDVHRRVSIDVKKQKIVEVLNSLFDQTDVNYNIKDKIIVLTTPDVLNEDSRALLFQQKTITGNVTDKTKQPLPGVTVLVKNTTHGAVTDSEGYYTLSDIPDDATVVFSFVGMLSQEVVVGSQTVIDIVMSYDVISMEEIVVTSFGIKREKKSLTYSTQSIDTEEITEAREMNVLNSLEGKVAGLSINSSGEGLGAPTRVVLRGNRSLSGDSQPLYVVDGVPISGSIDILSPDNIASVSVLKGANAAALYGSEAQNGVILVETKKGSSHEQVFVSFSGTYMTLTPVLSVPFQNVYGQGLGGIYEKSNESSWGPKMNGQMVDTWSLNPEDAGEQYAFSPQSDNKSDIFNKGFNLSSNLFVSVNTDKAQTAFSYTSTNGEGIVPNNKLQRHNVSLRVNNKLSNKLSLDTKIAYIYNRINNEVNQDNSNYNPTRQIYLMPSNIRIEDVKQYQYQTVAGQNKQNFWNPGSTIGWNPYWTLNNIPDESVNQAVLATTSLNYSITDDLNLMLRGSFDGGNVSREEKNYNDSYVRAPNGKYILTKSNYYQLFGDFLLTYEKEFNHDFNLALNVGGSMKETRNNNMMASTGTGLIVPNFFTLSNTNLPVAINEPGPDFNTNSIYSFGNFSWKDALFLDITGRNDWSSTLPPESRSYFYPSFGASVILNEFISFPDFIPFTKLRVSYAEVGSSAPPYMLDRTASFTAGGNYGFLAFSSILPNKELVPERTKSIELGFDTRFFTNRIGIDFTMYKTNTANQLFTVALPVGSGASSYFTNGGDVQNKGIEIVLSITPVITNSFKWGFNINYSVNRNLVTAISDERPQIIVNSNYIRDFVLEEGEPFGEIYAKGWERDEQGRVIVGANGIPLFTHGKDVMVANFNPDWKAGFANTFTLKRFSLSFLIEHRQGGSVISNTNALMDGNGITERTLEGREGGLIFGQNLFGEETAVLEDGSPNNIAISAQEFWLAVGGRNNPIGEAFVRDATNTRLRELTFGYSLPTKILANVPISNVKFSLVGRNLFYIYKASPELDTDFMVGTSPASEGFTSFAPPTTRSIGFSFKIDF